MHEAHNSSLVAALAKEFASRLIIALPEHGGTITKVIARNKRETNGTVCHSHDFLDANDVMAEAFLNVAGHEHDPQSDEDLQTWNAAWNMAVRQEFFCSPAGAVEDNSAINLLAQLTRAFRQQCPAQQHDADTQALLKRIESVLQTDSTTSSVPVKYWDAYGDDAAPMTHNLEIVDQRQSNGQAFITLANANGDENDMLSMTAEINTNPLDDKSAVCCVHVHFDDDALAVSLFKVGDRILVRPERDVQIEGFHADMGGFPGYLYWIE